jgi:D-alanyl-D-alanine carboxypeptidase
LVEASTGKVLHAENATYPWYPASVTKLMTAYTALSAVREGRLTLDTLLPVTRNAVAQAPTKMGFKLGTEVTLDNALKMIMVKSANDVSVTIAEGIGGSIEGFADMMNANSRKLGMTQSNWVNPNGLPAENQITSARDMAILARALIREFPQYQHYWSISSIRYGRRVYRNYNTLIDRYPGADGMKTGFICASGFNLVASASRNGRRLVVVVFGSYSSAVRAQKAAQLLENGFNNGGLSWLTPSFGTVEQLKPVDAQPPNLREEMCGAHRRKPPSEENDEEQAATGDGSEQNYQLSALKPAHEKFVLGPALIQPEPIVVFTGPPGNPDQVEQTPTPTKKPKKQAVAKKDDAAPAETKDAKPKTAAKKDGAAPAENKTAKPKTAAKKDSAPAPKEAKKDGEPAAKPAAKEPAAKKPAPKKDKAAAAAPAQ